MWLFAVVPVAFYLSRASWQSYSIFFIQVVREEASETAEEAVSLEPAATTDTTLTSTANNSATRDTAPSDDTAAAGIRGVLLFVLYRNESQQTAAIDDEFLAGLSGSSLILLKEDHGVQNFCSLF